MKGSTTKLMGFAGSGRADGVEDGAGVMLIDGAMEGSKVDDGENAGATELREEGKADAEVATLADGEANVEGCTLCEGSPDALNDGEGDALSEADGRWDAFGGGEKLPLLDGYGGGKCNAFGGGGKVPLLGDGHCVPFAEDGKLPLVDGNPDWQLLFVAGSELLPDGKGGTSVTFVALPVVLVGLLASARMRVAFVRRFKPSSSLAVAHRPAPASALAMLI